MKKDTFRRAEEIGRHVAETGDTVRSAAKKFGVSKSTVHKDLTERLYYADRALFHKVSKILEKNRLERHIRGGNATREKYKTLTKKA